MPHDHQPTEPEKGKRARVEAGKCAYGASNRIPMHEAEAWWADNEAHKEQEKLQEMEVEEKEDAVAASQAHKFGSLLAIERIARKSGKEGGKVLAQNGFFFFSYVYGASCGRAGSGHGRQQFRCGNHWPGAAAATRVGAVMAFSWAQIACCAFSHHKL